MSIPKPPFPVLQRGNPLATGLVLGLPLYEGSGPVHDLSGQGNNGTLNGGVTWVGSQFGWCLNFDGTSGYVSTAKIQPANITIGLWVYLTGSTTSFPVLMRCSNFGGAPHQGADLYLSNVAAVGFETVTGSGTVTGINSAAITANQWTFIVGTYDGVTLRLYLNGVPVASGAASVSGNLFYNASDPWTIGAIGSAGAYFGGLIDAPFIHNRALSPAEIAAFYEDSFQLYRRPREWFLKPAAAVFIAPAPFLVNQAIKRASYY